MEDFLGIVYELDHVENMNEYCNFMSKLQTLTILIKKALMNS